jgi:hypothetical protein
MAVLPDHIRKPAAIHRTAAGTIPRSTGRRTRFGDGTDARYLMACGFIGEPVPSSITSGGAHRKYS